MIEALQIDRLTKTFGSQRTPALDVAELRVEPGEMVALIGASGSGKSTLLRCIGGLALADRGSIRVAGRLVQSSGRAGPGVRQTRAGIGMVFQQFNLVSRLSVQTNVLLGALSRLPVWRTTMGWFPATERARADAALARVGIGGLGLQRASTLSGGQQQRAAIARTLVQGAQLILADEPIASLDPESCRRVMETLQELNRADGITVVVTLHQVDIAIRYCRRIVALRAGRVVFDGPPDALTDTLLAEIYGASPVTECTPLPVAVFA